MRNAAIYIPSNRPDMMSGAVEAVQKAQAACSLTLPVYVTVEPKQVKEATRNLHGSGARISHLSRDRMGIGYARNRIVQHAARTGYEVILLIDDDEKIRGNLPRMLQLARRSDVLGIGSYRSIYGLLYKDTIMAQAAKANESMLFLHKGSAGYQSFALNVSNALIAGNFNPKLQAYEDHELCRRGMVELHLPWYIYTGVRGDDRVPRAQQSGHLSEPGNPARAEAHAIVARLWPNYISAPPKRHMCQWKKLVQQFVGARSYPLEDISTTIRYDWKK
jgi:hypothetical protein